jgi:hypothetical protein
MVNPERRNLAVLAHFRYQYYLRICLENHTENNRSFLFYLILLSQLYILPNDEWKLSVNEEFGIIWKKIVMAYFKILSHYLPRETEGN